MDVYEVIELADWYNGKYEQLLSGYQPLLDVFRHNASKQERLPIEKHLLDLKEKLEACDVSHLTMNQLEILDNLNVLSRIGPSASKKWSDRISDIGYDAATVANELDEVIHFLTAAHQGLGELVRVFINTGVKVKAPQLPDDHLIMSVQFFGKTEVNSIIDLEKQSKEWTFIARGIAVAAGYQIEDLHLIGMTKRSPLMVDFAMVAELINIIVSILKDIEESMLLLLTIREQTQSLIQRKLMSKDISESLKKRKDEETEKALDNIIKKANAHLKGKMSQAASNGLTKAIQKLFEFSQNGGAIEFKNPHDVGSEEDGDIDLPAKTKEALTNIQKRQVQKAEIRLLEDQLRKGK
jgi:hypothetical protein